MFKRALVSVSDKTNLIEFLSPLVSQGLKLVSTGGTARYLRDQGWDVMDVSEVTGFPEVLDGRVKTLHPHIHMGLLGVQKNAQHMAALKQFQVEPFDLVIGNLYPFEETLKKGSSEEELIENIDIGGPSFLRSSAKNFETVTVICDPQDYQWIQARSYQLTREDRKKLAAKVFRLISVYDQLISETLDPDQISLWSVGGRLHQKLRYGENSHQQAWWIKKSGITDGFGDAEVFQGKELSYNNLLDLDAALALCQRFGRPAAVAVKHNNPCGAAVDDNTEAALDKALKADPVSVFGGIVVVNFEVQAAHAQLLKELFLECVLAPKFSMEAREILATKKNVRVLQWDFPRHRQGWEVKSIQGGFLVQESDARFGAPVDWEIIGSQPDQNLIRTIQFGERVCSSLKSNAIAIVGDGQSLGLGMGQVNRVDAVEQALQRWKKHHTDKIDNVVLVSDAFFPFPDSVELAAQHGIQWIVQPGGSVKDPEVKAAAQRLKVNLILTGIRHFRH